MKASQRIRSGVCAASIPIVLAIPAAAQPVQIVFDLSADAEAVALQFDVMPHAGTVELSAPRFSGASPHVVESAVVTSGATRYLVYSTSGRPISPLGTVRASFTSSVPLRDGMIQIVNALASDRHGNEVRAQPTSLPVLVTEPPAYRSAELAASITLEAPVVDLDGAIASVQYYIDGASIGAIAVPPFAVPFTPPISGSFARSALAMDDHGKSRSFDFGLLRAYDPIELTGLVPSLTSISESAVHSSSWKVAYSFLNCSVAMNRCAGRFSLTRPTGTLSQGRGQGKGDGSWKESPMVWSVGRCEKRWLAIATSRLLEIVAPSTEGDASAVVSPSAVCTPDSSKVAESARIHLAMHNFRHSPGKRMSRPRAPEWRDSPTLTRRPPFPSSKAFDCSARHNRHAYATTSLPPGSELLLPVETLVNVIVRRQYPPSGTMD